MLHHYTLTCINANPRERGSQNRGYSMLVPRSPRADRGPRPKQGSRLLALRKRAGLTQAELALAVGVPQPTIALWEWSATPPRATVLPAMARALGVPVEALLGEVHQLEPTRRSGPVGEVQRVFEEVKKLPRKQQRKILDVVIALLAQLEEKKAG